MQVYLKVLACAALSGALAMPTNLQARQGISGSVGASGSVDGSTPDLTDSFPFGTLSGSGSLPAIPSLDGTGSLPAIPSLDGSGSLPSIPSLSGILPVDGSLPSLTDGSLPSLTDGSLPALTTPVIPSLPTGDFNPDAASAVFSSLSSAFAALPTPQIAAEAQAFQTFVTDTLEGLADVVTGDNDFTDLPANLTSTDGLNLPSGLPEPLTTFTAILNNGLASLFDAFKGLDNIPSPAVGVVPVTVSGSGDAAGTVGATSDADGNASTSGGVSASANSANAGSVSARDFSPSYDFTSILTSLASAIDDLIASYGMESFQSVIPTGVTRAVKKKN